MAVDPALTTAALAGAEKAIRAALELDPATRRGLAQHAGQVLAVHVTTPSIQLYLLPDEQGLSLAGHWDGPVTTELSGPLPSLLRLARQPQSSPGEAGVRVAGRTDFLIELRELLTGLELDWEELLSRALGDVAGHQGAQWLRSAGRWGREMRAGGERMLGEYLTEELRALPAKAELHDFYRGVDDLQLGVDRARARLERLIAAREEH